MIFNPLSLTPPTDQPWGINYGGGTNSTALIIECERRGLRPDWILFSDTGSERPETYVAIGRLRSWAIMRGYTSIDVTRWERQEPLPDGRLSETIEEYCLRTGYMPSKAYGFSGCSVKFKVQPAQRWRKEHGFARTVYAIGFDAGEGARVAKRKCERTTEDREEEQEQPWYPLYAWGITRERCREIIAEAGLPQVAKSACFFCPNNRRHEWERLQREHPGLYDRALALEANAVANGNARENGLLRSNGYLRDFAGNDQQSLFWVDSDDQICACYDGGDAARSETAQERDQQTHPGSTP